MKTLCGWRQRALARLAALGAPLPPGSQLAAHVGGCDNCRRAWLDLHGIAADLPGAVSAPAVPPDFQHGIWRRIDAADTRHPHGTAWRSWALAAGVAVAVVGMALVWGGDGARGTRQAPGNAGDTMASSPGRPAEQRPSGGLGVPPLKWRAVQTKPAFAGSSNPVHEGGLRLYSRRIHSPVDQGPSAPSSRRPPATHPDLLHLNEGALAAVPYVPVPGIQPPVVLPLPKVEPGSRVVDDLLLLNPVLVAAADDTGLAAAAAAMSEEAAERDARLQQRVTVHAVMETLDDALALLTRGTGVTLMARMEIADEPITVWAENRPLIDVMRDLRHLRGYYWSRTPRGNQYVYSLWQDMQSRAREEAEEQRRILEAQRQFAEDVRKRIGALNAGESELKRLAQEEPYLVAQMKHPVVRSAYQLFAALSPDQQAQLLQGQTPCRASGAGQVLDVFPRENYDQVISDPKRVARNAPRGDVVMLRPGELTAAQRTALDALMQGAPVARQQEQFSEGVAELKAADRRVESVSIFRWGDPLWQGISLRVDFTSGGHPWGIYSNFALPRSAYDLNNDLLHKGEFRAWAGGQDAIDRLLGATRTRGGHARSVAPLPRSHSPKLAKKEPAPNADEKPDPILDAPVSVRWPMAQRATGNPNAAPEFQLTSREVLALLYRDLRHPLVLERAPWPLSQLQLAEFRYEKRPLRGLLKQLFPKQRVHVSGGTIFVSSSPELRQRHQAPRAVREFLEGLTEPFTLDDMAMLARSLSPWQMANLGRYFPETPMVIDQAVLLQPLLKLYGELAPAQRSAVAKGIPFTTMTPTQQALFLSFAQQQRPFVEAWRLQQGTLRISVTQVPKPKEFVPWTLPAARTTFEVRFREDDAQSYTLALYPQVRRQLWPKPAEMVGKPFPFPKQGRVRSIPAFEDAALRKKSLVIACGWAFALPYAEHGPAPDLDAWSQSLAKRLQNTGMMVVHVTIAPPGPEEGREKRIPLPNLIRRVDPGIGDGQPWDTSWGDAYILTRSPTVFVVGADEIVRAVFEGQDAWDVAAIERAAREIPAPGKQGSPSPKVGRGG